jgi:hypothetical protein
MWQTPWFRKTNCLAPRHRATNRWWLDTILLAYDGSLQFCLLHCKEKAARASLFVFTDKNYSETLSPNGRVWVTAAAWSHPRRIHCVVGIRFAVEEGGRWRQRWWRIRTSAISVEWCAGRGRRGRVIGGPKIIMWCACGVSCIFVFNLINSLVINRSTNKMELIPSRYFKFLETRDFHLSCQLISWCMIVQYKWHEPISFGFSLLTFLHSFINCSVVSSPHSVHVVAIDEIHVLLLTLVLYILSSATVFLGYLRGT